MKRLKNYVMIAFLLCTINTIFTNNQLAAQDASEVKENTAESPDVAKEDTKADKQKDGKAIKLNTIVITATRTKEKLKDVPANMQVITSKEIEGTGADNLGDAIGQKITGNFKRYSGASQSAGIMANFAADALGDDISGDVLVLVDGHRLGTGNLGKIPPEIIERVEVIKGPASAIYGSGAMGGVINIITKKGKGNLQDTAKIETGSFDYMRSALTSGGRVNDFAGYFITGNMMKVNDYNTEKYGTVYNSSEKQAHIWGNLSLYPADNQYIRLGFSYADIISNYPQWMYDKKDTYYEKNIDQYSDRSRGHIDAEYNVSFFNDKLSWKPTIYFLWDKNSWYWGNSPVENYDYTNTNTWVSQEESVKDDSSTYKYTTIGTDQQFTLTFLPFNKIVMGYTFESLTKKAESKNDGVDTSPFVPDLSYITNSVYAQDSIALINNTLNIILGARYDNFYLSSEHATYEKKKKNYDNISPRGGIVYKLFDFIRFRENIGQAFKTPTADKLTAEFRGWKNYMGNPNLKPEKSTTYDSGIDIYLNSLSAGFTYSKTTVKNKIIIPKTPNYTDSEGTNWYVYQNIGKSEFEIYDFYIDWSIGETLSLPVILTIGSNITINQKYKDCETGEDLRFVADRQVKSTITGGYKTVKLTLSHVYNGHELNIDGAQNPSFYFFNLTANYELSSNFSVEAGIFNLTNESYEWVDGFPAPERNYKIGLTGKF
jgi:vitamin B12 transporter